MHIPLKAIGRVRAEGRAVAIELTAAAGAVPAVHRYEDVDEAAATAFAEAVNAALPEEKEAVDGTRYLSGNRLTDLHVTKLFRRLKRAALYGALVIVALCVLLIATGHAVAGVAMIPGGAFALFFLVIGSGAGYPSYEEWHLRKRGVTVAAEQVPGEPGMYVYVDPVGLHRTVRKFAGTWTIDVAYDPQDPGRVVVLRSRGRRWLDIGLVASGIGIGLLAAAGVLTVAVLGFLGMSGL
ncbi:hypothetical protein GCM10017674_04450 [Streptomyces gardneri]|uniref:DUF3592 domain-containing protein n=2 Tax=Streptomyces gardneri TaxID=66892 RepID=A0A4Y3RMS3_9ACTN|nr:hypothetical protein SGA01_42640 [Streptomyces gardneri]GHG82646.1 hypothetical protein GCM10017674_04450 [Streptomyces gardneri]